MCSILRVSESMYIRFVCVEPVGAVILWRTVTDVIPPA